MRILWLINHKTLVDFEVKMLVNLGFEVYTPKVIPDYNFRSGSITFDYDHSLTIPTKVLKKMNQFNFWEENWNSEIKHYINKYFDIVFVIPHFSVLETALDKFQGTVVLRLFGIDAWPNYYQLLKHVFGNEIFEKIQAKGRKFFAGIGFTQILDREIELLKERAIFLPIGVPDSFYKFSNSHIGGNNSVLFLCSHRLESPYYANEFRKFRKVTEGFSRIVVDSIDPSNGDPDVVFKPKFNELIKLYQASDCFYTPTLAQAHSLYSPVEAAIIGLPIIFHEQSLLGRLLPDSTAGMVKSESDARNLIRKILDADEKFLADFKTNQRVIGDYFKSDRLKDYWISGMSIIKKYSEPHRFSFKNQYLINFEKIIEFIKFRFKFRILKFNFYFKAPSALLNQEFIWNAKVDPIPDWMPEKDVSFSESFGRWVTTKNLKFRLPFSLPKETVITVKIKPYLSNSGQFFKIKTSLIGKPKKARMYSENFQTLSFVLKKKWHTWQVMEFSVPKIEKPINDARYLSFALESIIFNVRKSNPSNFKELDFRSDEIEITSESSGINFDTKNGMWLRNFRARVQLVKYFPSRVRVSMLFQNHGRLKFNIVVLKVGFSIKVLFIVGNALNHKTVQFFNLNKTDSIKFYQPLTLLFLRPKLSISKLNLE